MHTFKDYDLEKGIYSDENILKDRFSKIASDYFISQRFYGRNARKPSIIIDYLKGLPEAEGVDPVILSKSGQLAYNRLVTYKPPRGV